MEGESISAKMMDVEGGTLSGNLFACVIALSAYSFYLLSLFIKTNVTPKCAEHSAWRWKNTFVSMIHSAATGILSTICIYGHESAEELAFGPQSQFACLLGSVSIGYFIHDMIDMRANEKTRQTNELLLHHVVMISAMGLALILQSYVGYAIVALVVELNSMFLHTRQLLIIAGVPKNSWTYCIHNIITIFTYVTLRIGIILWMSWFLYQNRHRAAQGTVLAAASTLLLINVMNFILFARLIKSDYFPKRKSKPFSKGVCKEN